MTLLLVIVLLAVWMFIALICLGLCVSAARGDRSLSAPAPRLVRARRIARNFRPAA